MAHSLVEAVHVLRQLQASRALSLDECSSVQMLIAELKVLEGAVNVLAEAETPLEAIKTLVTTVDKALLIKMAAFRSVEWPQMVVVSEKVFAVTDAWLESMMQRCPSMIQQKKTGIMQIVEEVQGVLQDVNMLGSLDTMVQDMNIADAF
ncbi:uncharacterized protein IUM83_13758 [Phytophthora cinnamomi]|uniref:uncharacterized protein n=1 Tax=Phytophthora cinnamomi TaxID=4785 RepID=UPI003559C79F|nr:hypothetical protein IUM83_13758 [Phytophthora cinnamomi]